MRVLVTGHNGYVGSVMVPLLQMAGHEIVGSRHLPLRGLHLRRRLCRMFLPSAWISAT